MGEPKTLDEVFDYLLQYPATHTPRIKPEPHFTAQVDRRGDNLVVEMKDVEGVVTDAEVERYLEEHNFEPELWSVTGMKHSTWTRANGEDGHSVKYTFVKATHAESLNLDIDHLVDRVLSNADASHPCLTEDNSAFVLAIGDLQIGKADGDGVEGTIARAIGFIDEAAERYVGDGAIPGHVHIAWLGDHIEGFESQKGANVWRTPLGLTDQLRIMRRIMLYAVQTFAPLCSRLTMAAVPGNHGRVTSNGAMTTYSDNFDTDCLIAVSDAVKMAPEAYGHVEFFVPAEDELTVVVEVGGAVVAHAHGHQWSPGKHMRWWKDQSFGGYLGGADILLAGHLHHLLIDTEGKRMFLQVPSLESESTWWRHRKGTPGNPGVVTMVIRDGKVPTIGVIS